MQLQGRHVLAGGRLVLPRRPALVLCGVEGDPSAVEVTGSIVAEGDQQRVPREDQQAPQPELRWLVHTGVAWLKLLKRCTSKKEVQDEVWASVAARPPPPAATCW